MLAAEWVVGVVGWMSDARPSSPVRPCFLISVPASVLAMKSIDWRQRQMAIIWTNTEYWHDGRCATSLCASDKSVTCVMCVVSD